MSDKRRLAIQVIVSVFGLNENSVSGLSEEQLYELMRTEGYYWTGNVWELYQQEPEADDGIIIWYRLN